MEDVVGLRREEFACIVTIRAMPVVHGVGA
jgi:hypothetical protein